MRTIVLISLLLCTLAAFVSAGKHHNVGRGTCSLASSSSDPIAVPSDSTSNIELDVFSGSNAWWLAIAVKNTDVDTQSVQIKDSQSSYAPMVLTEGWGYWTYTFQNTIVFPVSVTLTSVDGQVVTLDDVIDSVTAGTVATSAQYGSDATPSTAPTSRPGKSTSAPTTKKSSGNKHTTTTTQAPASHTSTTKKATTTKASTTTTTQAPASHTSTTTTKATTTKKASTTTTKAPTTTKAATSGSNSGSGCSGPISMLVPLYSYPGSDWNTVAASGSVVPTVAIINPNSGPGTGPDSSYTSYMGTLNNAGVEMIGYVHTSYGARAISDVKADIDVYASQFPHLVGIFLDEASADSSQISYYTELYSYILSFPGWKYDVLNPGAVPASGYNSIATQIVTYESAASGFASSSSPSGASCSNKNLFSVITYAASSASTMESVVDSAVSKGYYGWVYATSGTLSGNTYGALPSYYAQMATYIASKN